MPSYLSWLTVAVPVIAVIWFVMRDKKLQTQLDKIEESVQAQAASTDRTEDLQQQNTQLRQQLDRQQLNEARRFMELCLGWLRHNGVDEQLFVAQLKLLDGRRAEVLEDSTPASVVGSVICWTRVVGLVHDGLLRSWAIYWIIERGLVYTEFSRGFADDAALAAHIEQQARIAMMDHDYGHPALEEAPQHGELPQPAGSDFDTTRQQVDALLQRLHDPKTEAAAAAVAASLEAPPYPIAITEKDGDNGPAVAPALQGFAPDGFGPLAQQDVKLADGREVVYPPEPVADHEQDDPAALQYASGQ